MTSRVWGVVRALALGSGVLGLPLAAIAADPTPSPAGVYRENCALCHGEDARGLSGPDYFGPNLIDNGFVRGLSDEALVAFLKVGRTPEAPDSKLHLLMPACDYLSNAELSALVRFLRGGA